MFEVRQTQVFSDWFKSLRDDRAAARIATRIVRAEMGNLGDHKSVGEGVSEMRIQYGPGYRLYFTMQGKEIVLLLCGGDKGTQDKDIKRAKELARKL